MRRCFCLELCYNRVMIKVCLIWLVLPNGRVVLQRRDLRTNVSPGLLGLFGGHIEPGESPEAAIRRELSEETSLDVSKLAIEHIGDTELPHPNDRTIMRKLYFYKAAIDSDDFDVFEGAGAETYSVEELKKRRDLAPSAAYMIDTVSAS
jgi:8-oxo-dGTP diphosphatase